MSRRRSSDSRLIEITVEIRHETDSAYLVDDGSTRDWVPKSQVEIVDDNDGDAVIAIMPEWLAKEKGFI